MRNKDADEAIRLLAQAGDAARAASDDALAATKATATAKAMLAWATSDDVSALSYSLATLDNPDEVKSTLNATFDAAYVTTKAILADVYTAVAASCAAYAEATLAKAAHGGIFGRASAARLATRLARDAVTAEDRAAAAKAIFDDFDDAWAAADATVNPHTLDDLFTAVSAADLATKKLAMAAMPFWTFTAAAKVMVEDDAAPEWNKAIDAVLAAEVAAKTTSDDALAATEATAHAKDTLAEAFDDGE